MKLIVVLLILFCLCEGQKRPPGKPKPKPKPKPPAGNGCPAGWIRFRDSDRCYYISDNSETFASARDICVNKRSQLATPLTFDQQYYLNELLVENRRIKCKAGRKNCDEFWIGVHRRDSADKGNSTGEQWLTGRGFEIDTSVQCHYFSRRFPKGGAENCVIMSIKGSDWRGVWVSANCNRKLRFVCIACPNDFEYFSETNECINFVTKKANWSEARQTCAKFKRGAHLLTIQYQMKQQVIERYLPVLMASTDGCDFDKADIRKKHIWLGAQTQYPNQCKTPYFWKPMTGSPIPVAYTNWLPGTPNCGSKDENCAAIVTVSDSKQWDDLPCSKKFCYACEF